MTLEPVSATLGETISNPFMTGVKQEDEMGFTLGEAAKASGISKPTLSRAIKSGKLSATKQDGGSYSIEASELFRAFPKPPSPTVPETVSETPDETIRNPSETPKKHPENNGLVAALEVKVEMLERMLSEAKANTDREREMVDSLSGKLDRMTALLPKPSASEETKKGFFSRLFR